MPSTHYANVLHGANITQGWGYTVAMLDNFLLKLFDKYAELLKRRFSVDFQEVGRLPYFQATACSQFS